MSMIIILMGVSGCGKTTIGKELGKILGWDFHDGDNFHSPENVKKMNSGIPLTDKDREPWLKTLGSEIKKWNQNKNNAILACSALKARYREILGVNQDDVKTVFLKGSYDLLITRLESRKDHYMDPGLLNSQLETLEEPISGLAICINQTPQKIIETIVKEFGLQTKCPGQARMRPHLARRSPRRSVFSEDERSPE